MVSQLEKASGKFQKCSMLLIIDVKIFLCLIFAVWLNLETFLPSKLCKLATVNLSLRLLNGKITYYTFLKFLFYILTIKQATEIISWYCTCHHCLHHKWNKYYRKVEQKVNLSSVGITMPFDSHKTYS